MKKPHVSLVALLLSAGLCCAGNVTAAVAKEPVSIVWGTASMGSSAQIIGTAVGVVVAKHQPHFRISAQTTGGSLENPRLLDAGKIQLAHTTEAYNATTGVGPFKGEKPIEMWSLFTMYSNELILAVLENSPIKSVEDLAGKRVATGPPGSGTNQMGRAILDAYGLLDKTKALNLGYNEAIDALKDGTVDCFANFTSASLLSPALTQFDHATKYRLLPLDPKKVQAVCDKFPDFAPAVILPGSLKGHPAEYPSFASFSIELADSKMSDDVAYTLVKTLYDHLDELKVYHQIAGRMTLNNALEGLPKTVPVHPGAARYYKEKGVWRDGLVIGQRK